MRPKPLTVDEAIEKLLKLQNLGYGQSELVYDNQLAHVPTIVTKITLGNSTMTPEYRKKVIII